MSNNILKAYFGTIVLAVLFVLINMSGVLSWDFWRVFLISTFAGSAVLVLLVNRMGGDIKIGADKPHRSKMGNLLYVSLVLALGLSVVFYGVNWLFMQIGWA